MQYLTSRDIQAIGAGINEMSTQKIWLGILSFVLILNGNTRADFTWQGTKDSNFQNAGNWDTAPAKDGNNNGALLIGNGSGNGLVYTEKEGATTFNGQLLVGVHADSSIAGALTITGGTLTINGGQFGAIIGQNDDRHFERIRRNSTFNGRPTHVRSE